MLNETEQREIEAEAAAYPHRRSACIDALNIVQRQRGWISDESVKDIAAFLAMTPAEVDAVATFYNLIYRRPVGRTVIHLCDSISCWVMGCGQLCAHLRRTQGIGMGDTTADGQFTLLPIQCLGACDHAPAVMIDGELQADLDPPRLDALLREHAAKNSRDASEPRAPSPEPSPWRSH
ncbi:MAG: NADH-quinone oxidoreductase subunit NuoE [Verrucomicrobia bacterium]|nr:NADH-quinone oxidoreductase subunit NuoE [Verrucomicrobiota bacterium]